MGMSNTISQYLDSWGTSYELVHHPRSITSMETAAAAHVPGDQLAKAVVVEDDHQYLIVVIPSTHRLRLGLLCERFERPYGLATEQEIQSLFSDCETGSVPPLGEAYGLEVVVDDAILESDDVYFEAGDHAELVHVSGEEFRLLLGEAAHGQFGQHV